MEENSEKALKIIEQQYTSFINLQDGWDFFRGLAEYTKTIQGMAKTRPFIDALEKQREVAKQSHVLMNARAMNELEKSSKRLMSISEGILKQFDPGIKQVQEMSEMYQPLVNAIQEAQDRMSGRIFSSNSLQAFESNLFDIAKSIKLSGFEEVIREFENDNKRIKNIYGNYTFSSTYERIEKEERKVDRKKQVETWGAWEKLPIVRQVVFEPDEVVDELKTETENDGSLEWGLPHLMGITSEMEKIREGKVSDNDIVFFRVKDFKSYAQRVHAHITTELLKVDAETEVAALRFDDANRTLHFMNKKIIIAKKEESDPHKLMRTLFRDEGKVWANDEVHDDWGFALDEEVSTNKFYQAGKKINNVVAQDTTIKDFLIVSTKSVSINKKYLKL